MALKRAILFIAVLAAFLFTLSGCGFGPEAEINGVLDKLSTYMKAGNASGVGTVLDDNIAVTLDEGVVTVTRDEYVFILSALFSVWQCTVYDLTNRQISVSGDQAFVSATLHVAYSTPDGPIEDTSQKQFGLVKRQGGWKISELL